MLEKHPLVDFRCTQTGYPCRDWGSYVSGLRVSCVRTWLWMNPQPRHVPWLGIKPVTLPLLDDAPTTETYGPGLKTIFKIHLLGKQNIIRDIEIKNKWTVTRGRWEGIIEGKGERFSRTTVKETWTKPRGGGIRGGRWVWLGWGEKGKKLYLNNNKI